VTPPIARWLSAALASAVLVAAVTAVIALLEPGVPALGLGVLYLLAVVPMAVMYGTAVASVASLASMAVFNYFFLPPRYSLDPGTSERWSVLVAFLVSALVVSQFAARSQRAARRSARLADEQAALRRVATLVARGDAPPEVFAAVAREVGLLLGVDATHMARYEPDGTATVVAAWSPAADQVPTGIRVDLEGESVAGLVFRTGRPARIRGYEHAPGPTAALDRELGLRSSVGAPVVVDQRRWGVMIASSKRDRSLPADAESRIAAFTELSATAIANAESQAGLARLAEEQAALRRVATLVARGTLPDELFAAVVEELGRVIPVADMGMGRYESDGTMTTVAISSGLGDSFPVGGRWSLGGKNVSTIVAETGRSARIDDYDEAFGQLGVAMRERGLRSAVGAPIVVEGRVWGVLTATSMEQLLPADSEARLASFTELVATAIANAESRAGLARLAEEQAALQRVATLVARGTRPEEVFAAVLDEVGRLLSVDLASLARYEPDGSLSFVASWGRAREYFPVGTRRMLGGENLGTKVFETGRSARIDNYGDSASGPIGEGAREAGINSSLATPIMVEGRLWGLISAGSTLKLPLPADTEARLSSFTELVATAISNSEARTQLAASRARIVAATDEERRRVVRDLHDGAQQRLVHTIIMLKLSQSALQDQQRDLPTLLTEALDHAQQANVELRELAHGILPAALTQGGLRAGVDALASRMSVPVEIDVPVGRLPTAVEATAYFVVAEALTNVAKHAHAQHAEATARIEDGTLAVQVRDDGVGGARPDGSGLLGLADRLAVLDGELRVESPAAGGTLVAAAIPLSG
jgi:signal transduction histidine kinase